ncbi:hypothetical protein C8N47_12937 [Mangrovibacterium marinum]|uniref:Uncharacterized protein n=1 Tax=Mangrovibacterium marinum TaxID=1639118 RepID=A0A2T5BXC7_9BACT|nr:hypothetical protein C8N47_12937 [Mangrovibacterium marinum]
MNGYLIRFKIKKSNKKLNRSNFYFSEPYQHS